MKKLILLSLIVPFGLGAMAQTEDLGGVTIVTETYAQKISANGEWAVGYSVDGGTVCYNIPSGKAVFYGEGDYGRGNVVSDNGWVVGCMLLDGSSNRAVIMSDGKTWTPSVFNSNVSSNIHAITPDGSRICGVIGGVAGYDNVPFYCDIDANGTVGKVNYLPKPDKDLFGTHPQYVTATWISEDGKTIAGQVKDERGFILYPILYKEGADGSWKYSFPSQSVFNTTGIKIPEPVKEMEEMFPDAPYPEIQKYMTPENYKKFQADNEPWGELPSYFDMNDPEQKAAYDAYIAAEEKYWNAQMEYNELYEQYDMAYWNVIDHSLTFLQNAMALSLDGKWLASSAKVYEMVDQFTDAEYYIPYLCNLETGEWIKASPDKQRLHTNQVLEGGVMVCNSLASDINPANTYVYVSADQKFMQLVDYMGADNSNYVEWLSKHIFGDLIVGEDDKGNLIFEENVPFTGQAAISKDGSVIVGGVPAYLMGYQYTYFTYIFPDVAAGVEEISKDADFDGVYRVYNLQGVKIEETRQAENLKSLPKGIYIINGKKVAL